jgi:hypothetical protein
MAVILTDMNMPGCCVDCEFGRRFDNSSCLCERLPTRSPVPDFTKRPDWCPLVEVEGGWFENSNQKKGED